MTETIVFVASIISLILLVLVGLSMIVIYTEIRKTLDRDQYIVDTGEDGEFVKEALLEVGLVKEAKKYCTIQPNGHVDVQLDSAEELFSLLYKPRQRTFQILAFILGAVSFTIFQSIIISSALFLTVFQTSLLDGYMTKVMVSNVDLVNRG